MSNRFNFPGPRSGIVERMIIYVSIVLAFLMILWGLA